MASYKVLIAVLQRQIAELREALDDVLNADAERNEVGELTAEGREAHNRARALLDRHAGEE